MSDSENEVENMELRDSALIPLKEKTHRKDRMAMFPGEIGSHIIQPTRELLIKVGSGIIGAYSLIANEAGNIVAEPEKLVDEKELMEMTKTLRHQYIIQHRDFRDTGYDFREILKWGQIARSLTPEIILKAIKIKKLGGEPVGLLLPDNDRYSKMEWLDINSVGGQDHGTYIMDGNNEYLWNGGEAWLSAAERKWGYIIVDGKPHIRQHSAVKNLVNYRKVKALVNMYENEGLDVLTGVDAYLMLMRQSFKEDADPIDDSVTYTVLNPKNLHKESEIAFGVFGHDQIVLNVDNTYASDSALRVRAAVKVAILPPIENKQ